MKDDRPLRIAVARFGAYGLSATVLLLILTCLGLLIAAAVQVPGARMRLMVMPVLGGSMALVGVALCVLLLSVRSSLRGRELQLLTTAAVLGVIAGALLFGFG